MTEQAQVEQVKAALLTMYSHRGDGFPTQYVNPDGAAAVAAITDLQARLAASDSALQSAMLECSKWAREAGEAKGKLEGSEMPGIVDDWREKCEGLERKLAASEARETRLREALVEEREENLWNAYNSGHVKNGEWTHLFMSEGEWLARECGFDPKDGSYPAEMIKAAIPVAARAALSKDIEP
jgi:hypothetical protein